MKRSNSITMTVKEIWQGTFSFCKPVNGRKVKMVRREDWGQHKNGTLFVFDYVAKGCADSRALNPRQTGDLQLVLEFGTAHEHNTSIILGEFAKLLEIDSDGAVLYDIYERNLM